MLPGPGEVGEGSGEGCSRGKMLPGVRGGRGKLPERWSHTCRFPGLLPPAPQTSSSPSQGFRKVVLAPLLPQVSAQRRWTRLQPPSFLSMQGGPKGPGLPCCSHSLHPARAPCLPRGTCQSLHRSRLSAQSQMSSQQTGKSHLMPSQLRRGLLTKWSTVPPSASPAPFPRMVRRSCGAKGQLEPLAVPITVALGCWHLGCRPLVPAL